MNGGEGCLEGASLRGVRGALVRPPGHAILCHRHSRAAPCAAQPIRSSRPESILIAEAAVRYLLIKEDQDGSGDDNDENARAAARLAGALDSGCPVCGSKEVCLAGHAVQCEACAVVF